MARDTDGAEAADPREEVSQRQQEAEALARWGAASAAIGLLGLFMAADAVDQYYFVSGMGFAAFGVFLGARLLARWQP